MGKALALRTEHRLQEWAKFAKECGESGMSNRDFCALRGVSEKTYYYWLRRLRVATADALGPQFIEVKLDEKAVQPGILSIRYMEAELTITQDTTSEVLQVALAVLKSL